MGKIALSLVFFVLGLVVGYYLWALNGVGELDHAFGNTSTPLSPPFSASTPEANKKNLTESDIAAGIIGTWNSVDDPTLTREFSVDASVVDTYSGTAPETIEGRWAVFTSPEGEKPPFPVARGVSYLRIILPEEALYFGVVELSHSRLVLEYLDGGGTLSFRR